MADSKLFGISAAARACGCAEDTLRRLDAQGIVSPVRDSGGRRLFSQADIEAARAHLTRDQGGRAPERASVRASADPDSASQPE
ncbi:MAG: MerR family DNA-binding transcriptional regulator [Sinobacteraceae bacterium]|nr:MerR family DNA-binding transcriptional regulator [Nevskiaceae bacterium]MCP5467028.1 MerR family DNA-binding transcriptional regulator [Nevskiaceae bacterium]MCP5472303.1 MerR family DNA-binding transcriptional regulator [Nevskiaceae bacterium]